MVKDQVINRINQLVASGKMSKEAKIPNPIKFLFGGSSGMAAQLVVQPLDLLKTRMQVSGAGLKRKEYKSSFHLFRDIIKNEGFFAIYKGSTAGLLRQATYTTTRIGIYTWMFELCSKDGTPPNFAVKAGLGMVAGICGAFAGTPAEIALIRMTSDGRHPPNERRNYKNVIDALIRISREEGIRTLWRGALPTMGRAMVVNATQLGGYSQAKQMLVSSGYITEGILLHAVSSMISGFAATAASMPIDIVKTRLQNMKAVNGVPEYSNPFQVMGSILKHEGIFAFWKGFTPYYFRLGPHTILTLVFLEQLDAGYYKYVLGEKPGVSI